jgi:hypothetical protein
MILVGMSIAVLSALAGVWGAVVWYDFSMGSLRLKHKQEMDEIFAEVKRLRAQVAGLIGKE